MQHILIVDDDVELCELVAEYLRREGLETEHAMRLHGEKVQASNAPDSGLLVELRFPLSDFTGHEKR